MKTMRLVGVLLLNAAIIAPAFAAPPLFKGMPPRLLMTLPQGTQTKTRPASPRPALSPAQAAQFTIIDAPGAGTGNGQGTLAETVDSHSNVAGQFFDSSGNSHGFFRTSGGAFKTIDADGPASQTAPLWMNQEDTIVGDYMDKDTGEQEGFLYTLDGNVEIFDGAGGGSSGTSVISVSDKDEIAGYYVDSGSVLHAFLRAKDGTLTQFETTDAGTGAGQGTSATDVNDSGTSTGYYNDSNTVAHGFLRIAGGAITEFDAPGAGTVAGTGTFGQSINAKGWIVGFELDAGGVNHGFVRAPDGTFKVYDAPDGGHQTGQGTGGIELNRHLMTVGPYWDANTVLHGYVRARNGLLVEFDAPGAGTGFGLGTFPYDINADNIIAGWDQDNNGVYHGFLRTP